MAVHGNCFECLGEDVRTLAELYTAAPGAVMVPEGPDTLTEREQCRPHLPLEAGHDKATSSPAASTSARHVEKGALSSPEDDLLIDKSPSVDGCTVLVELPVDQLVPTWRKQG